jgi:transposase-like protein
MKKAEQMRQAVQQWKESGLTQKAYCEKIGVKRTTFANWVGRSKEKAAGGFIAVTPQVKPVSESIELIYPNGVRLKINATHISVLSDLIRIF